MAARVIPPEAEVVGGPVPGITRVTTQPGYGGRDIGYSPILEPLGAQLRIPHRVLDRPVPEPELQRPSVLTSIGVVVPARVPQHVHVHWEVETRFLTRARRSSRTRTS